jgi:amino acid adenylation domain-containing protein
LCISDELSIKQAVEYTNSTKQSFSDDSTSPSNVLMQVPHMSSLQSCRPIDEIPLQIYGQVDGVGREARFVLWYNETAITDFHAQKIVQNFSATLQSIVTSKPDDILRQTVVHIESDMAWIKALNSTPQKLDARTIHNSIKEVCDRNPNSVAIEAWDGRFTRLQLHELSEKLAFTLARAHVKRGCTVAVVMDKSIWVPVIMLAILKAGGAFLLLDPALPQERLKIMAKKCSLSHAVAAREYTSRACAFSPTVIARDEYGKFHIVKSETDGLEPGAISTLPQVDPLDIAFVIFTSGSSGIPKAIRLQHYAWCSGNTANIPTFGIKQGARVFQYSSYSFIISVVDSISTLLVGGTICIPGNDERMNDLDGAIRRLQPEYACLTPSLAKSLDPTKVSSIKTLVLVGEAIPRSLAESWLASGKVVVRNGYGQSEACSMNSTVVLRPNDKAAYRSIGRSTWLRYWIVDPRDHHRLMPVGALGELIVEGYSIALDYYDDEQKTSAAFIESPRWAAEFGAGTEGRRWYKTGDLVQYQQNGELHLFGRKDTQTKINGQRLETSEVEHHILQAFAKEISQVVVDKTIEGGVEKLIAFVTIRPPQGLLSERELRKEMASRLKDTLPRWMIPSVIKTVETFPRTATGKLDRRTLKAKHSAKLSLTRDASPTQQSDNTEGVRSQTDVHQVPIDSADFLNFKSLASKLLKTPPVVITASSSWADLGGDSLVAMMFVRDARAAGYAINTKDLLSGTTLEELSGRGHTANPKLHVDPPNMSDTLGSKPLAQNSAALFPPTDFQQHYLRGAGGVSGGYVCEYDLSFRGSFELARLEKAVRLLIEKTEALRLTFVHESAETEAPLKQKAFPPTKEELLLRCQVQRKDDPAPPLMLTWEAHDKLRHPVLFVLKHSDVHEERSPTEASSIHSHISMLIRMHHAVFDGISWSLILDDLIFAYEHGHLGKERPSYLQYLETRLIRRDPESLEYWSRLLKDSTPTRLRRDSDAFNSITADRVVPEHEAARLINFAREKGKPTGFQQATGPDKAVSGAVLSMSAWALTLRCILTAMRPADNHDDILFLALMHGRDEDGRYRADEIIGCCVTEIPIRVRLSEELTPAGLFTAVQKQLLESASHAHLGANTIAKHCTTWKSKEHFYRQSTFFMFQNVKESHHLAVDGRREQGSAADNGDNGDDASSAGGYMDISPARIVQDLRCDFEGHASMADHGTLEFGLASRAEDYSQDETDAVADAYVKAVRLLTEEHDMTIGDMRRRILREVAGVPV